MKIPKIPFFFTAAQRAKFWLFYSQFLNAGWSQEQAEAMAIYKANIR